MPEKYRKFALELGEMYVGRRSAFYFEWTPKFIKLANRAILKRELMKLAEEVVDNFLKELK